MVNLAYFYGVVLWFWFCCGAFGAVIVVVVVKLGILPDFDFA